MTIIFLNKIFFILFFMCVFNILNHTWNVINKLRQEIPDEYTISPKEKFLLGLSVSYIITTILTGITI